MDSLIPHDLLDNATISEHQLMETLNPPSKLPVITVRRFDRSTKSKTDTTQNENFLQFVTSFVRKLDELKEEASAYQTEHPEDPTTPPDPVNTIKALLRPPLPDLTDRWEHYNHLHSLLESNNQILNRNLKHCTTAACRNYPMGLPDWFSSSRQCTQILKAADNLNDPSAMKGLRGSQRS